MATKAEDLPKRKIAAEIASVRNDEETEKAAGPYAPGQGRRENLSKHEGRGYCDYVPINEDLLVNLCNRQTAADIAFNFVSEGFLKFHYRISGTSDLLLPNGETVRVHGPICGVLTQPKGESKGEVCVSGEHERWMTVLCSPQYMTEQVRINPSMLPSGLRDYAARKESSFHTLLPLESRMVVALNDLLTNDLTGELRSVYMEGKVLELISLTLNNLCGGASADSPKSSTKKEREQLRKAIHVVGQSLAEPPLLADLGAHVGMSTNRLNRLFKESVGLTYAQYVLELRMRKAHDLLRTGNHTITEIAHMLGYDYAGNFSAAFRRFFGVSPKSYKHHL